MAKHSPQAEASVETGLEAAQDKSAPISFEEPISAADLTAGVGDKPEDALPPISQAELAELQRVAGHENAQRDFTHAVLAARTPPPEPVAPPPLAPRIVDQTNAEIEAGRKMNAHHAALAVHRPAPVLQEHGEKTVAVFRPNDFVPDQAKGQGYTQGRNL